MRLIPTLIAAIAIHAAPALAQDVPDMAEIVADFQSGAHESARTKLKALIEAEPTPNAHYRFGRMLIEGLGGPVQSEEGLDWMRRAAEEGHLGATSYIGRLYLTDGPSRNPSKAAQFFTKAAAGGYAEAKYYLGILHLNGDGVLQDNQIAKAWLEGAAQDGFGLAMDQLSRFPDIAPDEAQAWQEEAARAGVASAQFAVAQRLQSSGGNTVDVVALYEQAAKSGFVPAQRALGTLYLTGATGLEPDAAKAEAWLRQAVQGQDLVALLNLGLGLMSGTVLTADPEQAEELLLLASDNGAHQASLALARAYQTGTIRAADPAKALALFQLADQQGSRLARQRLGQMVLDDAPGLNVPPHSAVRWMLTLIEGETAEPALAWLTEQARGGNRQAQAGLGQWALAQEGRDDEALLYLDAAARAGDVGSQFRLGQALSTGRLGDLDYVAAHRWLNIAAASGLAEAAQLRDTITDLMTAEDIAAAQDEARAFLEAARDNPPVGGVKLP